MDLTKNRLYNLIMQEVDKIAGQSIDSKIMLLKISSLPAKTYEAVEKFQRDNCKHIFKVKEKQREKKCLKCGLIKNDNNV